MIDKNTTRPSQLCRSLIVLGWALWVPVAMGLDINVQEDTTSSVDRSPTPPHLLKEKAQDVVVVTATRSTLALNDAPMAVSVLDAADFDVPNQGLGLDEWLAQVPGLYFENRFNFAQNLRISTRGFGARAPFGVRGIRLITDGFSDTLPDGQAQVDGIDLLSLTGAEVIRGPSSVLYGNASGGVIALTTEDGEGLDGVVRSQLDVGGDGFRRIGAQAGKDAGLWHGWLSVSDLSYQGEREHSGTDKKLLNAQGVIRLAGQQRLRAVVGVLDQPLGQDPGALTLEQVTEDRWQASGQSVSLNAGQSVRQARVGMEYTNDGQDGQSVSVHAFRLHRDFEQQLPSSFFPSKIAYQRTFTGAGATFEKTNLGPWTWTVGFDWAKQADDRQRFSVNRQGQAIAQTQDEMQTAEALGAFAQAQWHSDRWTFLLGMRADDLRLDIDDFRQPGTTEQSVQTFKPLSLMGGVSHQFSSWLDGFVSVGEGFESPSFTEIKDLSGGAGFARPLAPAKALNHELGIRARWASGQMAANVFWIETTDEIVVVDAFDGVDIFDNAGQTDRTGFEWSVQQALGQTVGWQLSYTYADHQFEDFVVSGESFNGNALPGLPRHTVYTQLDVALNDRWSWWLDGLWVDDRFADNANETAVPGHHLVNMKLRYRRSMASEQRWEWVIGVNNVFDQAYFSNIRINANRGAYYEPGPSRTWFSGISIQF